MNLMHLKCIIIRMSFQTSMIFFPTWNTKDILKNVGNKQFQLPLSSIVWTKKKCYLNGKDWRKYLFYKCISIYFLNDKY